MRKTWALLVAIAACGDDSQAPGGNPDAPVTIDAPADSNDGVDGVEFDSACDQLSDAGICCAHRRIYLNFDGVDLVRDTGVNDARTNHTFLIPSNKTVPPFLGNMSGRDTVITGIVTQLLQQLAGFDVELTRVRPSAGDYMMVVFGGDSQAIIGQMNVGAFGPLDCGNTNLDDLALVFDTSNIVSGGNSTMFVLGLAVGLSTTSMSGDCLATMASATPCTLSASAPLGSTGICSGAPNPQNEPATFAADLSCR